MRAAFIKCLACLGQVAGPSEIVLDCFGWCAADGGECACAGVLMRLALDQLIWAPAFIAVFISALMTLEVRLCSPQRITVVSAEHQILPCQGQDLLPG